MKPVSGGRILIKGLAFPEGPRWRDGQLWFTDQHAHEVITVDLAGRSRPVIESMDDRPGGLGFLPDGTPLVVAMTSRRVHRIEGGALALHADLRELASFHCNDMLVDGKGRAYVGNFGYDIDAGAPEAPGELMLVEPTGEARVVSGQLIFPNGAVLTPDGRTMMVAESFVSRISAFDVEGDGSLSSHRVWAEIEGAHLDGLCLDAEGAIWAACPNQGRVVRILPSGEVTAEVTPRVAPYACMLGGPDRTHLFALCSATYVPEEAARTRPGCIEVFEVTVPGAGFP